ncbi:MAG: 2-amino-4-hydroxy-6-hydroxymethyldihydropteridine diphosphokinase [Eubacteriaceae bacterium]
MSKAYLGLGSNIGDKKVNLEKAIQLLEDNKSIVVIKKSSYYETEPVGYKEQDWFLNMVVEIETSLEPEDLLEYCQWIEKELKRKRIIRWGPRTIDVDILVYEDYESCDETLTLPHPRICERAFVMIPLHEIAPTLKIKGKSIEELLKNFKGEEIKKI